MAGGAGGEVAAEERLVDVVRADFEVVAHRPEILRKGEVILVLTLDLRGRLRGVDVLSDLNATGVDQERIARAGEDRVLEVRVLKEELVQFVAGDLPGVADQHGVIIVGQASHRARRGQRAGSIHVRVLLIAVAHLQELLGGDIAADFAGDEVILEWCGDDLSVECRIDAAGIDDVVGGAVEALSGDEEVRAILDDRSAE